MVVVSNRLINSISFIDSLYSKFIKDISHKSFVFMDLDRDFIDIICVIYWSENFEVFETKVL
jgi:hypothetical protein